MWFTTFGILDARLLGPARAGETGPQVQTRNTRERYRVSLPTIISFSQTPARVSSNPTTLSGLGHSYCHSYTRSYYLTTRSPPYPHIRLVFVPLSFRSQCSIPYLPPTLTVSLPHISGHTYLFFTQLTLCTHRPDSQSSQTDAVNLRTRQGSFKLISAS